MTIFSFVFAVTMLVVVPASADESLLPVAICTASDADKFVISREKGRYFAEIKGQRIGASVSSVQSDRCDVRVEVGGVRAEFQNASPLPKRNTASVFGESVGCDFTLQHFVDLCGESYFKGARKDHFKKTSLGLVFRGDLRAWDHARNIRRQLQ